MPADLSRIVLDPRILCGKPTIKGTRLSVELILGLIGGGWSHEAILDSYPGLTVDDICACAAYASSHFAMEFSSSYSDFLEVEGEGIFQELLSRR